MGQEFIASMLSDTQRAVGMAMGAAAGYLAGHPVYVTLGGLIALDFVSAILLAGRRGNVSSAVMGDGLLKKGLLVTLLIAIAWGGRHVVGLPAGEWMAGALCVREIISIAEHAIDGGIWVPPQFKRWLDAAQAEGGGGDAEEKTLP